MDNIKRHYNMIVSAILVLLSFEFLAEPGNVFMWTVVVFIMQTMFVLVHHKWVPDTDVRRKDVLSTLLVLVLFIITGYVLTASTLVVGCMIVAIVNPVVYLAFHRFRT